MTTPTKKKIASDFARLQSWLDVYPLTRENGTIENLSASEFMWMQQRGDGSISFKHIETRNYAMLNEYGHLTVPRTNEPFMRGKF